MSKKKNKITFESYDLFNYLWSNSRLIIIAGVAAFFISLIISLFMTPMFKSSVVLFPASSASFSKSLLTNDSREDFLKFGGEEESEQLMQVLLSSELRDRILKKFDLLHHYKIDPNSSFWRTNLNNEYHSNIQFRRTEFMSVVIDVWDKDSKLSADIANQISDQVDSVLTKIQHERASKAFMMIQQEYFSLQNEIKQIEDTLKVLSDNEIIGSEVVSKAYHTEYAKALVSGRSQGTTLLEKKIHLMAQYGGLYTELSSKLTSCNTQLGFLHEKFIQARVDAESNIPHKFVVDKAYPSDKKDKPKRMLIVVASTLAAMFFMLVLLLIRDSISNRKQD